VQGAVVVAYTLTPLKILPSIYHINTLSQMGEGETDLSPFEIFAGVRVYDLH
jgi:hypothetical protein